MSTDALPPTAVLGLGPMGGPIAANLVRAGVPTTVWNRTPGRDEALVAAGARRAATPAQAAAPVILAALPDVPHLRSLLDKPTLAAWGGREGAGAGTGDGAADGAGAADEGADEAAILVVLSTTGPEQVQELAADLAPHGIRVLDAPMSGGVAGAEAGTLSLMVGGPEETVARVRPVLEVIGGTVIRMGDLGAGSLAKLCNQVVVAGTLTALAEALALARAGGLDPADLVRILEGGLGRSEVLAQKKDKLLQREYSLGGNAVNQRKDLRYAHAARERLGVRSGVLDVLLELFEEVVARGDGEVDHTVIQELFLPAPPAADAPADPARPAADPREQPAHP